MQHIIRINNGYNALYDYLRQRDYKTVMLVVDSSFDKLTASQSILQIEQTCECRLVRFDGFISNPQYDSVVNGVDLFNANSCEAIIAVGGGSAIDVAKCIKLYAKADKTVNYLAQKIAPNNIELIAVPTTAGTGSEATKYSVIYLNGEKQSVTDESIIPHVVVLDETVLYSLPDYQKKSTLCDAFFHAVESYWSVNSTVNSKQISQSVIMRILENAEYYLCGDRATYALMQEAAYDAGRTINITQTTAGHAMSYKLTSMFGIAHGHAVAIANCGLVRYMVDNIDKCTDVRGKDYLESVFNELSVMLGGKTLYDLPNLIADFVAALHFNIPTATKEQLNILSKSVNPIRIKNNPIGITQNIAYEIYKNILTR